LRGHMLHQTSGRRWCDRYVLADVERRWGNRFADRGELGFAQVCANTHRPGRGLAPPVRETRLALQRAMASGRGTRTNFSVLTLTSIGARWVSACRCCRRLALAAGLLRGRLRQGTRCAAQPPPGASLILSFVDLVTWVFFIL